MLKNKHIVVGISGGIAAYKIPELIRLLIKEGAEVKVTTTLNALNFVTELTLRTLSGNPVYSDVFSAINTHSTEHISLPDWADAMLIAPATANVLGKMADGIADDALTTTFAATVARKPVVIAPAMNDKMYANAATQEAMQRLTEQPKVRLIDCAEGFLACGTTGKGRMQELPVLMEALVQALTTQDLTDKHVLITAGPTQEPIDPVRYVSNYSSGKMGYAIARECLRRGATVTLVSGPTHETIIDIPYYQFAEHTFHHQPAEHSAFHSTERSSSLIGVCGNSRLHLISVQSAKEMFAAAKQAWQKADMAILSAAVADFTPKQVANEKRKKESGQTEMTLPMVITQDIAAHLGKTKQPHQRLIGFALETEHEQANAQKKLESKHLDMIVLNSLRDKGAGFGVDTNKVCMFFADGTKKDLPLLSKQEVAKCIVDTICEKG